MSLRLGKGALIGVGLVLAALAAAAADKVWVVSAGAKLMAEAAATAKVVATPAVGVELSVLAIQDKWYQVSAPTGEQGWIYRGRVSATPPEGKGGSLFGPLGQSGIQANAADASRSIRGLSPEAEQYAQNAKTPGTYKKALDGVLSLKVADADVDRFLREGRIGEYAP